MNKQKLNQSGSLDQVIVKLEESFIHAGTKNLYKFVIEAAEKPLIEHVLIRSEGNQLKAAKILGINRNTLRTKIKKLGIKVK